MKLVANGIYGIDNFFRAPEKVRELVLQVDMKFNQCVLFHLSLFHSAGDFFGESINDGCLTPVQMLTNAPDFTLTRELAV